LPESSLWFRTICLKNNLPVSDGQLQQLGQYVSLLMSWNEKVNLISRKDTENVWANHILHCVSLLFSVRITEKAKVVDLGTGGGLPGIPLKIMLPGLELVMIDSTQKKILAVQNMIGELGLDGASAVWGRGEELASKKEFAHKFNYVVARAVAPLADLVKIGVNLLSSQKVGGAGQGPADPPFVGAPSLIAFKGGDLDEEVRRARTRKDVRSVDVRQLVFHGSEEISLSDKKLVVVGF